MYKLSDGEKLVLTEIWNDSNERWEGPKYNRFYATHSDKIPEIKALQTKELILNTAINSEMRLKVTEIGFLYLDENLRRDQLTWAQKVLDALRDLHKKDPDVPLKIPVLSEATSLNAAQVFRGLILLAKLGLSHGGNLTTSEDDKSIWILPNEDIFTIKGVSQLLERRQKDHEARIAEMERPQFQSISTPIRPTPSHEQKEPPKDSVLVTCDACGGPRNHVVLKEEKEHQVSDDPDSAIAFADCLWQIVRCSGCDQTRFREHVLTSEDCFLGDAEPKGTETVYPTPQERKPKDFQDAPDQIRDLYRQTIHALNDGMRHLCAAGLRALLEALCADRAVEGGIVLDDATLNPVPGKDGKPKYSPNLDGKVWGLAESGLVTQQEARILHKHRYLGNDALHQALAPTFDSLINAVDVLEHVLEKVYELPRKADAIQRGKP